MCFIFSFEQQQQKNNHSTTLVAQLVLKRPVHNVLMKTSACGGHVKTVESARTWIHHGNMNAIAPSATLEWIVNWNYWPLVYSHHHEISLLQLLFVLVHWYVSSYDLKRTKKTNSKICALSTSIDSKSMNRQRSNEEWTNENWKSLSEHINWTSFIIFDFNFKFHSEVVKLFQIINTVVQKHNFLAVWMSCQPLENSK